MQKKVVVVVGFFLLCTPRTCAPDLYTLVGMRVASLYSMCFLRKYYNCTVDSQCDNGNHTALSFFIFTKSVQIFYNLTTIPHLFHLKATHYVVCQWPPKLPITSALMCVGAQLCSKINTRPIKVEELT